MTAPAPPAVPTRVAVIGAGVIGRGWASLAAVHGWPVTILDSDARAADSAMLEIANRVRALVSMGRGDPAEAESGLSRLKAGRSILQACGDATWVIECVTEDLALKQRVLENIEGVARPDAIVSSSSSGLAMTDMGSHCRDQTRLVVTHPLNPPELIPLIEVVPGKFTSAATVDTVCAWLRALGRLPIALKREVPGNVVGRIAAAVYRECVDLVLTDVVDVDQIDRAVSLGPSLGWAAAGPHLTYHLGAGEGGLESFMQHLMQTFEIWWGSLAKWDRLEPEQVRQLTALVEKAYGNKLEAIRGSRDRRLATFLKGLESSRRTSGQSAITPRE